MGAMLKSVIIAFDGLLPMWIESCFYPFNGLDIFFHMHDLLLGIIIIFSTFLTFHTGHVSSMNHWNRLPPVISLSKPVWFDSSLYSCVFILSMLVIEDIKSVELEAKHFFWLSYIVDSEIPGWWGGECKRKTTVPWSGHLWPILALTVDAITSASKVV